MLLNNFLLLTLNQNTALKFKAVFIFYFFFSAFGSASGNLASVYSLDMAAFSNFSFPERVSITTPSSCIWAILPWSPEVVTTLLPTFNDSWKVFSCFCFFICGRIITKYIKAINATKRKIICAPPPAGCACNIDNIFSG